VLTAGAALFAARGVDGVSLRDIAAAADVNPALISRYVGPRDQLVAEVFAHASAALEQALREHPLDGQGFTADTPMGQWVRIAGSMAIAGYPLHPSGPSNPVQVMGDIVVRAYGISEQAGRLRAAQITAAALGWRIFEDYLVEAADLDAFQLEQLRDELARSARRLGATDWPSPPDPTALPV
jgi:AcrR family transcriptional regulator